MAMKANETASTSANEAVTRNQHRRHSYQKVLDGRKQPLRGLWVRNGSSIAKRQAAGMSGRTVNLGVIVLRNVLKRGIDEKL